MHIDLAKLRQDAGASVEALASYAGVSVAELEEWDRTGTVPREHVAGVRRAVWAVRQDAALAASGLPECEWIREQAASAARPDVDELVRHMEQCPVCTARSKYVDDRVGRMPLMHGGVIVRLIAAGGYLHGWQRSAFYGAALLLGMGGAGVLGLLIAGLVKMQPKYFLTAGALFIVLALSGAAGGIVHHATRQMRDRGTAGYYASSILTVYGYLLAVVVLLAIYAARGGWDDVDRETAKMLSSGTGLVVLLVAILVVGAFFGIVFGRAMRDTRP